MRIAPAPARVIQHQPAGDHEASVQHAHLAAQRGAWREHGSDAYSSALARTSPTSASRRTQASASSAGSAPATSLSRARARSVGRAGGVQKEVRRASKGARNPEAAVEWLRTPETGWVMHTSTDRPSVVVVQWLVEGAA